MSMLLNEKESLSFSFSTVKIATFHYTKGCISLEVTHSPSPSGKLLLPLSNELSAPALMSDVRERKLMSFAGICFGG